MELRYHSRTEDLSPLLPDLAGAGEVLLSFQDPRCFRPQPACVRIPLSYAWNIAPFNLAQSLCGVPSLIFCVLFQQ